MFGISSASSGLALATLLLCLSQWTFASTPAVALYYGANPPWDELRAFDVVVVDPDHPDLHPAQHQQADSQLFAYVSVGEVQSSRAWFNEIPPNWLIGENKDWGAHVIDQSAAGWPEFFVDKVIAPLWAKGYRGFFLDTLDSWQLIAKNDKQAAQQQAGLIRVIRALKARFPDARLIFNRGFEILPQVHDLVWMLAAESLFQGYNASDNSYSAVAADDRKWLLTKLQQAQQAYHLPILSIDYVPLGKRQLARQTAAKIRALGFIPWVTTGDVDTLGVGQVEVIPRKVIVLYDANASLSLNEAEAQILLGPMLAYLGLVPDYLPTSATPPSVAVDRYAGVISWMRDGDKLENTPWPAWLAKQAKLGLPLAFFCNIGVKANNPLLHALQLRDLPLADNTRYQLTATSPLMGFEVPVFAQQDSPNIQLSGNGKALLTLTASTGDTLQPAAIMPWGGYVLDPYAEISLQGHDGSDRWLINPLLFLRAALKLDASLPVPDVTTETGRRLFFIHIDGDGFANKSDSPGNPYAGQVLLDLFKQEKPWPTTMSVIEGEVAADGLYPKQSPQLEAIARQIFALPNIEIGTHTYSHAFNWRAAEADARTGDGSKEHLPIKSYHFSTQREIFGSRDYINQHLAPPGKQVRLLQWPGDCIAPLDALQDAQKAGLLNINGGDTTITRSNNSWTQIAGLGVPKDGDFQVFAPNQNEMLYTNDWHGPYYGFKRVIETYELTDAPYRFKPINLYFHTYLVSKAAGLASLKQIYQWIDQQQLHPIHTSAYIRKVLDFNQMVIARTADGFRVRGAGQLHNLRISAPAKHSFIDWQASRHLIGVSKAPEGEYLSFVGKSADLVFSKTKDTAPFIAAANADATHFERNGANLTFSLTGFMPLDFALANSRHCTLTDHNNKKLPAYRVAAGLSHYRIKQNAAEFKLSCRA